MFFGPTIQCGCMLALLSTSVIASDIEIALQKRQNVLVGTGATPSASTQVVATSIPDSSPTTTDSPLSSSTPVTSTAPASSSITDISDSLVDSSSSSLSSSELSSAPTSSVSPTSSAAQDAASSASPPSGTTSKGTSQSTLAGTQRISSRTQQFITTIVTVSGSSTFTHAVTTSRLEAVTPSSMSTSAPGLNSSDSDSGKSGLSSGQKRTIIGVVVGIGGAILLGGLAVVAWRIWGNKKNIKPDDYDPMNPLPPSDREKTSAGGSSDPFRSNLDQHHNTGGPVNAASNF